MEYIIFGVALWIFFNIYVIRCLQYDKKRRQAFIKKLYTDYGKPSEKKYPDGRLDTIAGHYRSHDAAFQIDDITWNDLSMDDLFQRIDYTFSAAGEEALYTMLRCPCLDEEELKKREEMISYFMTHEDDRVALSVFFAKMGRTGKYSIYDYISYMDTLGKRSNRKHYAMLWFIFAAVLMCFVRLEIGLAALFVLITINMLTYFGEKKEIDPYITTFAYFLRVLSTVKELGGYKIPVIEQKKKELKKRVHQFDKFSRFSFLLMHQSDGMSGNPLDIILDYVRMILHLNLIKFNSMLREAVAHKDDLLFMIETLGYIEAMISVGCFRASLPYYVLPDFEKKNETFSAEQIYHPLIEEPVPNSLSVSKGVLLTGSNASGKSTFLKTIAISQILAQTIYTVPANLYQTKFYRVYTSMALRDDLSGGDSYFMVEIKAMKRILDAVNDTSIVYGMNNRQAKNEIENGSDDSEQKGTCVRVMSFVDEVLRGTNTVERISASTEILKSLAMKGVFSFAATHDIELTDLLDDTYENFHFEEKIVDGDVCFPYLLLEGKATTRNAIRLLSVMGFEKPLIENAEKRAEKFMESGEWNA